MKEDDLNDWVIGGQNYGVAKSYNEKMRDKNIKILYTMICVFAFILLMISLNLFFLK